MDIIAHGIDLVDCPRIAEMLERHGERFLNRVFTPAEQACARGRYNSIENYAGRFAAKERSSSWWAQAGGAKSPGRISR
jgi:holo-[acyl-carrier protein] synthase